MSYTVELDEYEKDTLMETIQYRIEEDTHLLVNGSLKSDLKDLLDKLEEDFWERVITVEKYANRVSI